MYKARPLGSDRAFVELLGWLNELGAGLDLRLHRVLDQGLYGWAEVVDQAACEDADAARHLFQRAGQLLAVLHMLDAVDCHVENLVAAGEQLVLVDMETVLNPVVLEWLDQSANESATAVAHSFLRRSVLGTGLLPNWSFADNPLDAIDMSGLGGGRPRQRQHASVRHPNTDAMARSKESEWTTVTANVPLLHARPLPVRDYVEEIVAGFKQTYSLLVRHRDQLLASNGPLAAFEAQSTRLVFRATHVYAALLARSREPEFMRDGIVHSMVFERLGRAFVESPHCPAAWPLFDAETAALERGDVPYFFVTADGLVHLEGGVTVSGLVGGSALDNARDRCGRLNETDRELQADIIRAAVYASGDEDFGMPSSSVGRSPASTSDTPITPTACITRALAIAREIERQAIRGADGSAAWCGLSYLEHAGKYQFSPLQLDLYGGIAGIGFFLAALQRIQPDAGTAELARRLLTQVVDGLQARARQTRERTRSLGPGAGVGIGGLIYVFTRASVWLNSPALLVAAGQFLEQLTPEAIATDRLLDPLSGSAGAILALRTYSQVVEATDPAAARRALTLAERCGDHLLGARVSVDGLPRAWPPPGGSPPLTGFSHGAAGITYALLRLYAWSGAQRFLASAVEGIAYERTQYVAEQLNWRDHRSPQTTFAMSWCNGAPGIGMGRAAGLDVLDDSLVRAEISAAMATTRALPLGALDQQCCGNMGRAEAMLYAGRRIGDAALADEALRLAGRVVARADAIGHYSFYPGAYGRLYDPSLFRGAAGVGYTLLRLAQPELLPSVLVWE
jgi:type 2 lantibiotic biosynthesis protein LanM